MSKEEVVAKIELLALDSTLRRVTLRVTLYNGAGRDVVLEAGNPNCNTINIALPVVDPDAQSTQELAVAAIQRVK